MKGDIAVAGFMMTAEEWQALDAASRAQLVAVITRQDPTLASGSGPVIAGPTAIGTNPTVVVEPRLASGTLPSANLADGTNPVQLAEGTSPGIEVPDLIEELPSGAVIAEPS